jgi:hypothetical protein
MKKKSIKSPVRGKKLPNISPIKIFSIRKTFSKSPRLSFSLTPKKRKISKSPTNRKTFSLTPKKRKISKSPRLAFSPPPNRKTSPKSPRLSFSSAPIKRMSRKRKSKRVSKYCGNNKNSSQLRENGGDKVIGTNYECMRIGFGAGYHNPIVDIDEFLNYEPIYIKPKMWCGNGDPKEGYVRGYPSDCLKKGFGAGQRKQAEENNLI